MRSRRCRSVQPGPQALPVLTKPLASRAGQPQAGGRRRGAAGGTGEHRRELGVAYRCWVVVAVDRRVDRNRSACSRAGRPGPCRGWKEFGPRPCLVHTRPGLRPPPLHCSTCTVPSGAGDQQAAAQPSAALSQAACQPQGPLACPATTRAETGATQSTLGALPGPRWEPPRQRRNGRISARSRSRCCTAPLRLPTAVHPSRLQGPAGVAAAA